MMLTYRAENRFLYYHGIDKKQSKNEFVSAPHPTYEIIFFIGGNVEFLSETNRYTLAPYDLILIPPNSYHNMYFLDETKYERHVITVDHNIGSEIKFKYANDTKDAIVIRTNFSHEFTSIFDDIEKYCNAIENNDELQDILTSLLKSLFYKIRLNNESNLSTNSKADEHSPIFTEIINYINENIYTINKIEDIANQFYISHPYLFKLFKKNLGISPHKFLQEKKLSIAKQLLLKGLSPTEVAIKVGYSSYPLFYKAFKNYFGYMPSQNKQLLEKEIFEL